jgi:signal transduction histidine kinase
MELSQQVNTLKKMVDNLVTFATFLSKQGQLRKEELDFGQVAHDSVAPLAALAQVKGQTIHINIEEHLPTVQGDKERLTEAIHHLVQNAIKFNRPNGESWVHVWAADGHLHFEVKDSGVGVPADKLPTLWDAFAQMADPMKRGAEGLGLGLALVKYVVTEHGGAVRAESAEGVGSVFGFWVPVGEHG